MEVSLTSDMQAFVTGKVANGEFESVSDVMRAGLLLLKAHMPEAVRVAGSESELTTALLEGVQSGAPSKLTETHWNPLHDAVEAIRRVGGR